MTAHLIRAKKLRAALRLWRLDDRLGYATAIGLLCETEEVLNALIPILETAISPVRPSAEDPTGDDEHDAA